MSRLTSVANVKRFLTLTSAGQDALIDKLIPGESLAIERYVGRRFGFTTATARRLNGTGTPALVLPEQPIVSVTGLTVNGVVLNPSADGLAAGFVWDDTAIYLVGGPKFPSGVQNVAAVWSSGYQATENVTVPTGNTPTVEPIAYGYVMAANAVTYTANGVALAPATGNLTAGHYALANGVFSFAAADANAPLTLVYSYVPADVEQACIEMVALDLRQRDNLGITAKSLAGESVTYEKAGMSKSVKDTLQPYRRMAPG